MKRTIFLLSLITCLFHNAVAQDTLWMSLDSCLQYAYRHNVTVQSAVLNQQTSAINYEGARLRFLPSINASASENLSLRQGASTLDGNYGVNASMPLFNGLNRLYNLQSNQLTQSQSQLKVEQSQNQVGSQIVSAYLTIVMNQERLKHQQEVLRTAKEQRDESELKFSVGRLIESDYELLQANYLSALSDIEDTRITIQNNQLALRTLLGMPDDKVIGTSEQYQLVEANDILLLSQDSVVAQCLRHLPDVDISQLNVDLAKLNVKMTRANFLPSLNLSAGASYYGGNSNTVDGSGTLITHGGLNSNVGLSLNIPILNQGTSRTQYKLSKLQLQQAELQHFQTQQETLQKAKEQYLATQQSLNKFRSSEVMQKAYKASFDIYVVKYSQGVVTTVELLQQQDRYLSALNEYLINKYSYMLQQRILDIYMGQ